MTRAAACLKQRISKAFVALWIAALSSLWVNAAEAAHTSVICAPQTITVPWGGTVTESFLECDETGFIGMGTGQILGPAFPQHGSAIQKDVFPPFDSVVVYSHNGISGTTDYFETDDINGGTVGFTVTILPPANSLRISPDTLSLKVGTSFFQSLVPSGGTGPYTFSVQAGQMVPGLALSNSGVISGTPTQRGVYSFTVRMRDTATNQVTDKSYTGVVASPTLSMRPSTVLIPPGQPVNRTLTARGGAAPYEFLYEPVFGVLPPGISLSASGQLTGMTSATLGQSFTTLVRVTDASTGIGRYFEQESLTIIISNNAAPTANAGPDQTVASASSVTLNGTGSSDPESQPLTYAWQQVSGPSVTLSNSTAAQPTFTAPVVPSNATAVQLQFELVVRDALQESANVDTVTITVNPAVNLPPVANAGPDQTVPSASAVSLTAAGSTDPENQPLSYAWTQTGGPAVTLSGANTAGPSFTAPTLPIGAANAVLTFTLTVGDGANLDDDTVTITVTAPPNTIPTANAGPDQSVATGSAVALDGTASSDPNASQVLTYAWTQTAGPAVTLNNATTATPGFTAPPVAFGGRPVTLTFQLIVNDGIASSPADTVTITVNAPGNTAPVANAGPDQSVPLSTAVTLDGSGSSDADPGTVLDYSWRQTGGTPVTLSAATSVSPGFTAPVVPIEGTVDLVFELTVSDGTATAIDTVTVRVNGPANTPPTVNAGPDQTVAATSVVTLSGTGSSANDIGQSLTYTWVQTSGPAVTLSNTGAVSPTFTAPSLPIGAADVVLVFELTVSDPFASAGPDSVSVRVTAPANTPPTADAGPDQMVASGTPVALNGTGSSDPDPGQTLTYAWVQTNGVPVTLVGAGTASPTFTAPTLPIQASSELIFELTIGDGFTTVTDSVSVVVNGPANTLPTANAGPDQTVGSGAAVTLTGAASSANDVGQTLTFEWIQTSGPAVTLSGADTVSPTFTAPVVPIGAPSVQLVFRLDVNDGLSLSPPDTVTITVSATPNTLPTANAGPDQTVASGAPVTLSGAGSLANDAGQTLAYAWTQTGGPAVSLTGAASVGPTFTAPVLAIGAPDAVLVFQLIVNDGFDPSPADTVAITVTAPPNTAPTANAGPDQTVVSGALTNLTGAASSPNDAGQSLGYNWVQTGGPSVTLTGGTSVAPSFTAPTLLVGAPDALLTFQLTVDDGFDTSAPDSVIVTVTAPPNTPPTANAGANQTVPSGTPVTLTGTGSSPNDAGQTLTYLWTQTGGPAVTLSSAASSAPGFTAPTLAIGAPDVVLTFSLVVDDGFDVSAASVTTVTVTAPPNSVPVANAGTDQVVRSAAAVTLDGTQSSDVDTSQTLTYAWTQVAGPAVALSGSNTATPTFTAPTIARGTDVELIFNLVVNDGIDNSILDSGASVSVLVSEPANEVPLANAGADQTVNGGASVLLDGRGSSDGENDPLTYSWTQVGGPTVTLLNATSAQPGFTAPARALGDPDLTLEFELVVNDGFVSSVADLVIVTIAAPGSGLNPSVTLTGLPPSYANGVAFTATITFSEPVVGFVAADLDVSNGTVSALSGGPMVYVATVTPTAFPSAIAIQVPANVATDVEGRGNTASASATVGSETATRAQQEIAEALTQRARALIASQPRLRDFLTPGSGQNAFLADLGPDGGQLRLSFGQDGPIWMSVRGDWSKTGEDRQDYVNLAFGAHLLQTDTVIVGAMVQLDDTLSTSASERFAGEGWLVGPYLVARAADQPLVFSASLLTGETQNRLTREGIGTDRFDSRRTLVTFGVEGQMALADGLILRPSLDIAHVRDAQEAYVDAASSLVAAQTVTLTEASFGLGFERTLPGAAGNVVLTGGLSGIYSHESDAEGSEDMMRGRLDLGADIITGANSSLRLGTYYDGIGASDFQAWGADLQFQMKF